MIEFDQACDQILVHTRCLGSEDRLIEAAIGCVLAEDITSPMDVSPFRNSAMDGFAVRSEWLLDCSESQPLTMSIGSTTFAGDRTVTQPAMSTVAKVMTGAMVPTECDAVVPFEDTDYDDHQVTFCRSIAAGSNVRQAGEDIKLGQKLYSEGTAMGALDIGVLATIGKRTVSTYRRPSILILGTGDELLNPGDELVQGKIYDSNTFTIHALVSPFCERIDRVCGVRDREKELARALDSSHDIIVTTGGVSAGERDLVVDMAEAIGWKRVFHKVAIKPGKPVYFATRDSQLLFGLPGNPLSTAVTCSVFLILALRKMIGFEDYRLRLKPARLAPEAIWKSGRKLIWPGFIREEAGQMVATFSPKRSSAALTALMGTDGLVFQSATDENSEEVRVEIILWDHILRI
ncbi:MAG: molybdopterin molybdotransferase MoeA [candidate division Zixibacteria bacterium]|nr:molybdopterin molybdotransferase MoeA [candidate division Zixibacteria bacterium]